MIENFGTGIPRTIESYSNYNVKPEFKATENFFIVTLPNLNYGNNSVTDPIIDPITAPITDPITAPITAPMTDPISNLGLEILKCLKIFPGLNTLQIVEKISYEDPLIIRDKVKNKLKRYLTNYVKHRGSNRNGGYYLKDRHSNELGKVE